MKLNIFHFVVNSLFRFAVSNSIISVLLVIVLSNINRAQSYIEESMMETDVANMRWELRELWAHRNATGQSLDINSMEGTNPLRLINEKPENYYGEYTQIPSDVKAGWYFDTKTNCLVYVFKDKHQACYRLISTAKLQRASLGAIGGIDLVRQ
ncbi:MAG: hypothetical protein ACXWF8_17350 [Methylobacter sp.]